MTQYKEANLDKQDSVEVKNFTRIPNILIYDYQDTLSPQEKWLYVCLKHMCGKKGTRHLSLRYISEVTGISTGALSTSKNKKGEVNLGMIRHLHDAGLIHTEIKKHDGKGNPQYHITITDIWALNQAFFSKTRSDFGQDEENNGEPVRNSDEPVQISDKSVQISDEPVRNSANTNITYKTSNKTTEQNESGDARALIAADVEAIEAEETRTPSGKIRAIRPGIPVPIEEEETKKRETTNPSKQTAVSLAEPVPPERSQVPVVADPPVSTRQAAPGLRITQAPTSKAVTQATLPEPKGMTDKQRGQAEKTGLERLEKEYWVIIEEERKTKYTKKQRELYENSEGMKCLIEDKISAEQLRTGLRALDAFQRKSFTVLKFYGWLPNLTAEDSQPQRNGRASTPSQPVDEDYTDFDKYVGNGKEERAARLKLYEEMKAKGELIS